MPCSPASRLNRVLISVPLSSTDMSPVERCFTWTPRGDLASMRKAFPISKGVLAATDAVALTKASTLSSCQHGPLIVKGVLLDLAFEANSSSDLMLAMF